MAFDEGVAAQLRAGFGDRSGITEKRMFGGLCFLLNGNMIVGVHGQKLGGGAMFRVGEAQQDAALAFPGTKPMEMAGRRMKGFVDVAPKAMTDGALVASLTAMALDFVGAMPPK